MTAQIKDIYRYNDEDYIFIEEDGYGLFSPQAYGFFPWEATTDCIRGFWCEYEISNNQLKLQRLHIHDKNDSYPTINGVHISPIEYMPAYKVVDEGFLQTKIPRYWGHQTYEHLELVVPYTGKLLLGKDLIKEFHFYPFPAKPYGYKTLLSFEFVKGELGRIEDFSETAQILRGLFMRAQESGSSMLGFGSDFELYRKLSEEIKKDLWWYEKDAPYF